MARGKTYLPPNYSYWKAQDTFLNTETNELADAEFRAKWHRHRKKFPQATNADFDTLEVNKVIKEKTTLDDKAAVEQARYERILRELSQPKPIPGFILLTDAKSGYKRLINARNVLSTDRAYHDLKTHWVSYSDGQRSHAINVRESFEQIHALLLEATK